MSKSELDIIEKWQSDPSFINWANDTNEADVKKWNAYFEDNPKDLEIAETAKFSIQYMKPKANAVDKIQSQIALSALQNKIADSQKQSGNGRVITLPRAWRVAASLLILVTAGIWGYTSINGGGDQIVYATQGEQKEVLLADGTHVTLNTNSTLTYNENEVRNVKLEGEAYFEVAKQPQTKANFTVQTEDLVVTVLGTEFNVNSEDDRTSVYLDEGKVKLNIGDELEDEIEMAPGELVSYSKDQNKVLENRKAKSLGQTAWKEKVIMFKEATLTEVLESVSLIYGVALESNFSDKEDEPFTGGIPTNDLDISLQTLKEIYQLDIKKIEEKYLIQ